MVEALEQTTAYKKREQACTQDGSLHGHKKSSHSRCEWPGSGKSSKGKMRTRALIRKFRKHPRMSLACWKSCQEGPGS